MTYMLGKGVIRLENLRFLIDWSIKEPLPNPFFGINGLLWSFFWGGFQPESDLHYTKHR